MVVWAPVYSSVLAKEAKFIELSKLAPLNISSVLISAKNVQRKHCIIRSLLPVFGA